VPPQLTVDEFLVDEALGAKRVEITAMVQAVAAKADGTALELLGTQTTMTVLVSSPRARQIEAGDSATVLVGRQASGGAFLGELVDVLKAPHPYMALASKLRSAGVSVTPDPANDSMSIMEGLNSPSSAFRVGPAADLLIVTTASSSEASAVASKLHGFPGNPATGRVTLYLFRPPGLIIELFASPSHAAPVVEKLRRLFGNPREVIWVN
jgi:hypothetical protein